MRPLNMPAALDFTVLSLHRRDGQDHSYLPGLLVAESPRRVARGRQGEQLVLHLSIPVELNINPEAQQSLLKDMAAGYYRTPGAMTTALREQIERLNAYFVQRNQQAAQSGAAAPVRLSLLALRDDRVTLAQCGPVQAFLLDEGIHHFYDPQSAGRGLGLGQTTDIRFFQIEIEPNQVMLLLGELPSGWNEKTLAGARGQKLATLRRRFLADAGPELNAVAIFTQTGSGKLTVLSGKEEALVTPPQAVARTAAPQPTRAEPETWEQVQVPSEEADLEQTAPVPTLLYPPDEPEPEQLQRAELHERAPRAPRPPSYWAELGAKASAMYQRALPALRGFLSRVLPEEPIFNLPPRVMGLIAILVPIAVVILVAIVYLQVGRGQLYINYLERAQASAAIAAVSQDPAEVRQAWTGVVYYAERAAAYEKDQQTAAELLAQAKLALDDLDAIRRVEFVPALSELLDPEANITRMVANNTDIYMLDSTRGKILRAFLTGDGAGGTYLLDEDFACEPGPYGDFIVSELVDMALLPRDNELNADLLAMDRNGNVIYCAVGERPSARTLTEPPSNWGQPRALRVEDGDLFVLDPLTNAVWVFPGEEFSYAGEPRFFFGAEVPSLRRMLDLAMEGDTLFLISQDGHMALCEFSDDVENPSTCEDPAPYTDTRPGRTSGETIEGANFAQLQVSEPPQPALYALDPVARTVYRFSLNLNLITLFQSSTPLPEGLATAFAIMPNYAIVLAFENEIYIGFMPSEP